jgi:hypothetical protein
MVLQCCFGKRQKTKTNIHIKPVKYVQARRGWLPSSEPGGLPHPRDSSKSTKDTRARTQARMPPYKDTTLDHNCLCRYSFRDAPPHVCQPHCEHHVQLCKHNELNSRGRGCFKQPNYCCGHHDKAATRLQELCAAPVSVLCGPGDPGTCRQPTQQITSHGPGTVLLCTAKLLQNILVKVHHTAPSCNPDPDINTPRPQPAVRAASHANGKGAARLCC